MKLNGAAGQMVNKYPIICGGMNMIDYSKITKTKKCYKITPQKAISLPGLATARDSSSAGVFNNAIYIVGGEDGGWQSLRSTEYISENNQQHGSNAPVKVNNHCIIQINANEILLTGGLVEK